MSLRCGIVGLPNVGKSTLFNALTAAEIAAENYPFCTIEPNVGIVEVQDPRLDRLTEIVVPKRVVPASVEFVDIAGLVAGASKGEGLGNKFLSHIRETEAIVHVVRCFDDPDVTHVAGRVDPVADVEVINLELVLADLNSVEKQLQKASKAAKGHQQDAVKRKANLDIIHAELAEGRPAPPAGDNKGLNELLAELKLLSAKPVLYVANIDESAAESAQYVQTLQAYAAERGQTVLPLSIKLESEISLLDPEERNAFIEDLGLEEPALNRLVRAAYEMLDLQSFFTAGVQEVRAWTIRRGMAAAQAAGTIHTDMERGFIRAEITAYNDYVDNRGEDGARKAGKLRLEGKDYIMADGDVTHFRFNV